MRRKTAVLLLTIFSLAMPKLWAQEKKEAPAAPEPAFKVGDTAPDFTLRYFDGTAMKQVSLHDFRGKKSVAVAFVVFAFTGG